MNNVNNFLRLTHANLCYILKGVGDFSNVSKVCKLFNQIATAEAKAIHDAFAALCGEPCLARAIGMIGLSSKSCLAKVDGLFFAAIKHSVSGSGKICTSYNQDHSAALKVYMRPWFEADATFKLWMTFYNNGHPELQELMSQLRPENDYLENVRLFRVFFEANRVELSKVTALHLSRSGLRVFPLEICLYLIHLKTLDLTKNFLQELPKEIGNLSELTDLRLNNNYLSFFPTEIGVLDSLENFQCSFNLLRKVPEEICKLTKLRVLNLSCNQLCSLPKEMGNFQALNYLYLEGNRLSSLPPSIGMIPHLIGLYFYGNRVGSLPNSFCGLSELKYLSAACNRLKSLPGNIGEMTSLRSLHIDNNKIKELPQSITSLVHLNQLFLSGNHLSGFPVKMGNLKKLKLFCFENNPIETFPDSMQSLPFWSRNPQFYPYLKDGRLQKVLDTSTTRSEFHRVYWGLGRNKWKECIDGVHHTFKQDVYDKGLHGEKVEPGFLESMMKAFAHLDSNYNHIIDADFYLELHKIACQHFKGTETSTLMGQEKVGKFRGSDDAIRANFMEPNHAMSNAAINEFQTLDVKISLLFGSSFRLGDMSFNTRSSKSVDIHYFPLSRDQVRILFGFFLTEFYYDIGHAKENGSLIRAIAKLIQRWEWLHPVRDGTGRTDTALLNFLLTCYGFNPVLLKFPYVSSCMGLNEWTAVVNQGMYNWEAEAGEDSN